MTPLPPPPSVKQFILFPVIALLAWALAVICGIGIMGISPESLQFFGQFGDMFGSLNALFSALAMSGAVYAVLLQNWQIQDQKRQFAEEKKHDENMFRRQKLEDYLKSLDSFRSVLMVAVNGLNPREKKDARHLVCTHAAY